MAEYEAKYVVCPFYCRTLPNRICCEGVEKRNTINLVFEDTFGNMRYKEAYCNSLENYHKCRVCRMLEEKYEEEEE